MQTKKLITSFLHFLCNLQRFTQLQYVGMMGTNVNNLIVFPQENWYKRPQPWWACSGQCPLKLCCAKRIFFYIHV